MAFFRIGSAGANWSNVGSWSNSSGGPSNGSAQPTSSDNVTFDTNSPATVTVAGTASANTLTLNKTSLVITLNGGSLTASGLTTISTSATINKTASETVTMTGLTATPGRLTGTAKVILVGGTWTGSNAGGTGINNDLDLQGNITLVGGGGFSNYGGGTLHYVSGTITVTNNTLKIDVATATLNLNGVTFNNITIAANCTLTSNLACSGLLTPSGVINWTTAETITSSGGLTTSGSTCSGTAKIILTGGTWTSSGANTISNSIDLQGNVTISTPTYGDQNTLTGGKTLTYVSGTITTTSSTLTLKGACTLNTNGVTWNNISTVTVSTTATLTSNFLMNGLFTPGIGTTINKTTAETWTTSGGMAINAATSGTAKIIVTGGTWSGTSTSGIANNVDLQGTITISGNVYYLTGTLTYISGTITVTSSTLNLQGSCTLVGGTYNNITCTNTTAQTYTINTTVVTANGTLTLGTGAAVTFAGTAGFTVATLTSAVTGAQTITLKNSITYSVTTALTCFNSRTGSILLFTSDDGTLKANLVLTNPSTCQCLASFTRIDASGGRTINSFNGTITSCTNILSYTDYVTVGL